MESKVMFNSKILSLSTNEDGTLLNGKVLICPLDESNLNKVGIKKDDALNNEQYKSLITQPAVAKVIINENDELDFSGHNLKKIVVTDENGNLVTKHIFDTVPIGVFNTSEIEEIEIDGVTKSCIVATVSFWTRYENSIKVIERLFSENNLHVSWEISYTESSTENGIKWLKSFFFIGVAVLGSNISPAYPSAGVMELSEINDDDKKLSEALIKDLITNKEINVSETIKNKSIDNSVQTEFDINNNQGGNENMVDTKKDIASLTDNDLYRKVRQAINATSESVWYYIAYLFPYEYKALAYTWDSEDTEFIEFIYTVNSDDTVSISSQKNVKMQFIPMEVVAEKDTKIENLEKELSEKNEAILKAGEELSSKEEVIKSKDEEIASLTPFKVEVEKIEAEKHEAEIAQKKEDLKKIAVKGGYINSEELETSEEIKKLIEDLDEKAIKAIIAERVIAKLDEVKPETEVSETSTKVTEVSNVNINNDDESINGSMIMSSWLKTK